MWSTTLHAAWANGRVCLWSPTRRASDLHDRLPYEGEPVDVKLWLPARTRLAPKQFPALALEPRGAAFALAEPPPERLDIADSVRFVHATARLVLDIVGGGRVVPVLEQDGDGWSSRWRPLPSPADRDRLRRLASAMPPAVRAADPERSPVELFGDLVSSLVDGATRAALDGTSALAPHRRPTRQAAARAVEAWLDGLTDATRPQDVDGPLAARLEAWYQSGLPPPSPLRVCFRLDPPPDDSPPDHNWRLAVLAQPVDEPSLLVPAAELWSGTGGAVALRRHAADPVETLLAGLGRAVRVYPPLEAALATTMPDGLELDAAGAVEFLRDAAPVLEEAGFGVLVPSWWARRGRLGLRLRARRRDRSRRRTAAGTSAITNSGLGLDTVVAFDPEIAVGDDRLTREELEELARLKQPLVRVRGQWVELGDADLAAALALTAPDRDGDDLTAGDVLRIGLGLAPSPDGDGLPVTEVVADGWLGDLLAGALDERLTPVPTPDGFAAVLRPYQERGVAWLAFLGRLGIGACLADDMGLGKTAQLLAAVLADPVEGPTLVVCPTSVLGNWQREAERFTPSLAVHIHHGADREREAPTFDGVDLVLTTYAVVARDVDALAAVDWGRVVLDEAQNVKNPATNSARAVRRLRANRRVALTGTPVENRLTELWSILDVCNPGLLGSLTAFRERFAIPVERHGDEEAADMLRRATGPFILRRLKTDRSIITDLPDKIEITEHCALTTEQASLYQAVVDDLLERIDDTEGIERRGLVLATMTKLKQVCNHPAHLLGDGSALGGRSGKLDRTDELLDEIVDHGDKALCFTQFAEWGHVLQPYLASRLGDEVLWLHGGVPRRRRDELVARFQADDGPAVMLLSLRAGGTGLNLTAASHVIHLDRWWNPAVEDQATDRAFRIGQRRNVQVRKLVCTGTLEERIDTLIAAKRGLAERVVGTGEAWLTELSTDELRSMFTLSPDAVAGVA